MGLLNLAIDWRTKALVDYNGFGTSLPSLYQSNVPTLRIYTVERASQIGAYSLVDLNGYSMRVSIGDTPTGTSGGPSPLALQDTFTWVPASKYFTADLALNTTAIDTFIGSAASKSAFFEVNITGSSGRDTILQTGITLKAVVDELTSVAPTPTDQYYTKAEVSALFQKMVGPVGQRLVLKSANGVYGVEIGVGDDGVFMANVITL